MEFRNSTIKLALFVCLCLLAPRFGIANETQKVRHASDRIETVEQFLKAVYPSLSKQIAMMKIDATFEAENHVTVRTLQFYPCQPSGSVPAEQISVELSAPQQVQPETRKPWCGADPTPEYANFLKIFLGISTDPERPIYRFAAQGDFVDAKLQELRQQFGGKPYPSDDEALRSLLALSPKYGPANKKELLANVPASAINEVTGCNLNTSTATFVLARNGEYPDLQWHIEGTSRATKLLTATKCSATFEPFAGKLTLFLD